MLPEGTRLISADDHLIEPAHLWVDRVPAQYREALPAHRGGRTAARPGCIEDELATSRWARAARWPVPVKGLPAGPRHGPLRRDPARLLRPGGTAVADMDIDGVWGQLCFPNYARFAGHRFFLNVKDRTSGTRACAPTTTTCSTSGAPPTPTGCTAPSSSR